MSGGQDEASERINTSDLPYWLAGPIKRLEARVTRLERYDPELLLAKIGRLEQESEDMRQQPATDQPAKRREWWAVICRSSDPVVFATQAEAVKWSLGRPVIRVIAAPSEADIEAAVQAAFEQYDSGSLWDETFGQTIRKLLGGGE